MLASWLDQARPLPVPEQRGRALLLEAVLGRAEQGGCLLLERDGGLTGCLPFSLVPSLALGGLAALALEWWGGDEDAEGGTSADGLAACCAVLADWCRAHGIRHLLLAPGLVHAVAPPAGFALDAAGMWRRALTPAAKRLG